MAKAAPAQQPSPIDSAALLAWYDRYARVLPWRVAPSDRARGVRPDPYRVWLSEIMLQQTTVAAVGKYYARFLALWPTVGDLAAAPLDAILAQWAGLGYYARARNLHAGARAVIERFGGSFPSTSAELRTLPGIGPYTAAAIAAIAFDENIAVVDGNVDRVVARLLALNVPVAEAKDDIRATVQSAVPTRAGDFAQAMMDLGATICAPRSANCLICPLAEDCRGRLLDPLDYPVKAEKAERPTRYGHAFVMRDADGDVFLRRRADTGQYAQMTETPGTPWVPERSEPAFPVAAEWQSHGTIVHVLTHMRLEIAVWSATVPDPTQLADGWWVEPARLKSEGLATVFRKVLAAAGLD